MSVLILLVEDGFMLYLMVILEFLEVVMWYMFLGRKDVRENVCLFLEKLFLNEVFKGMIGVCLGVMEVLNIMLFDEKYLKFVKMVIKILLVFCLL